jgi:4-alpha-glucanotransferase
MARTLDHLNQLAELYGVHTSYYDVIGQLTQASPDALVQVLRALGAALAKPDDASAALRQRRQEEWGRWLEPVTVAWDGAPTELQFRLPAKQFPSSLACSLELESGERQVWSCPAHELSHVRDAEVEGVVYAVNRLRIPGPLPLGYHRLTLEVAGKAVSSLLLSAPLRAYEPAGGRKECDWGVFLPLYALHSERSWGAGDFADLEALTDWVTKLGGGMVATLPLLAAFLDEPFEPGPYSPASRLFWNEFYLDLLGIPELRQCPTAQALLQAPEVLREVRELQAAPLVDYRRQMALKRRVLEELARTFFAQPSERTQALHSFLAAHPHAEDYARFRAVGERRRAPWPTWPAPLRDGVLREGDYEEEARRYHLYVQWLADEQLQAIAAKARAAGPGFYLDLPLGVNPDSYDVWRERGLFASNMAAGAPPDPFFAGGQNWGFSPLHPEQIRQDGYRYVSAYLRHHLRLAGVLRIDHMMGFHRLFWIPHGFGARDGVYVKYAADELYAVFSLESHRHRSILIGEDLGTVPPEVRPAMARHNINRMYVMQYELQPQYQNALTPVYPDCVAVLNTHDMPPFAGWWQGLDIEDRVELGILNPSIAEEERQRRRSMLDALVQTLQRQGRLRGPVEPREVLRACLVHLCEGAAQLVLANLEDLWLETQPQNVPGTWRERPNWRRKARYSLEAMRQRTDVLDMLREIDQLVKEKKGQTGQAPLARK